MKEVTERFLVKKVLGGGATVGGFEGKRGGREERGTGGERDDGE